MSIEENEGWGEFKAVNRRKFAANRFLDIQADKKDLIAKFNFELVHDGLDRSASNSIWGLEFEQDGFARTDHILDHLGIVHQRSLTRVHHDPCREQASDDDAKGQIITPFWFVGKEHEPDDKCQRRSYQQEGILIG